MDDQPSDRVRDRLLRVADLAVQLHGAAGLLEQSPEATLFRIARHLRVPAGTHEIQKNAIAVGLLASAK